MILLGNREIRCYGLDESATFNIGKREIDTSGVGVTGVSVPDDVRQLLADSVDEHSRETFHVSFVHF